MLVDTENLVSAEDFRANFDQYLETAQDRSGPLAVTRDSEVVGFFITAREFDVMFGTAVRNLLSDRSQGATISHASARKQVLQALRGSVVPE